MFGSKLSLIGIAILFATPALASCPLPELHQNAGWCHMNNKEKKLLDEAANNNKPDWALAGYLKCQKHQFCAVSDDLKKRFESTIGKAQKDEALKKVFGEDGAKIIPALQAIGISCQGKD